MTIAQVRTALAAAVDGIAGVRATPYVTDAVATPQAIVVVDEIDYEQIFEGGLATYSYRVIVYAQRSSERAAQILLDTLREPTGSTSIRAVIEADTGVKALVSWVVVRSVSADQIAKVGDIDYLAAEWQLQVGV